MTIDEMVVTVREAKETILALRKAGAAMAAALNDAMTWLEALPPVDAVIDAQPEGFGRIKGWTALANWRKVAGQ